MKLLKLAKIALICIAPFALSSCLVLPGEFTSEMTIMKSGDFTFSYKGQIQLLGLASLLSNVPDGDATAEEFTPVCYVDSDDKAKKDDEAAKAKRLEKASSKAAKDTEARAAASKGMKAEDTGTAAGKSAQEDFDLASEEDTKSGGDDASAPDAAADAAGAAADAAASINGSDLEERDCTKEEIADQKADWDQQQTDKSKRDAQEKKMMAALIGGIDPKDPKTITRFTKEVERLASWNKVEHLGNGLFMIDYSTKGRLADDFAFPIIPRYALGEPMIHVTRWDNGRVRIEAPSFHNDPDISMMAMMGGGNFMGMAGGKKPADPVEIKGSFTITTDADILANNTDEGPSENGTLHIMKWDIGPATYGAPMALLKLVK